MKNNIRYYSIEFYSIEIIQKAIQAYRKLSAITAIEENGYYKCCFADCVIDPERIIYEFDNYLIELMNSTNASVGL